VPATKAAAIASLVSVDDLAAWFQGAVGEIRATLSAQGIASVAPPGGIYAIELFSEERGEAILFVPADGEVRPVGRVESFTAPPIELAVRTHLGSHVDVDRSYGLLATHVAEHSLAVEGSIREYYLVGHHDTDDEQAWKTEIGWPIFDTARGSA
jgi:effector-binding domain-containing protein